MIDLSCHPRQQSLLLGHEHSLSTLQSAVEQDRMPGAWLVTGQRGIGKATLVYTFVRQLLSKGHPNPEMVCHQIDVGTYPNLMMLEVASDAREISADQARQVAHFLAQSAAQPGWRAIVIDAVDEMNRFGANALLKSIEEPPTQTVFFLIAHSLGLVLPTLRSRCALLPMKPLTPEALGDQAQELQPLLPLMGGSLGRAQALHKAGGLDLLTRLLDALEASIQQQWPRVHAFPASFTKGDSSIMITLDLIEEILRRLIQAVHVPTETRVSRLAQRRSPDHWVSVYEKIATLVPVCRVSHLDHTQLMMALFMIIDNPEIAKEWMRKIHVS